MDTSKDGIKEWLKRFNRSREWLGGQCGVLKRTVDNWLSSPQEIPDATIHLIARLMADDELAEKQRQRDSEPQSHLVIKVDADEFNAWEKIAIRKSPPQTVSDYCVAAIRAAFEEESRAKIHQIADSAQPSAQSESIITFPEVPLLRAAAGVPLLADAEHVQPDRELGKGRFLLELRGDSMEPRFRDRQRVVLRDKATLKRPALKYGEFYCFVHEGQACFKQWAKDASGNRVLRSLNPEHADIPVDGETDWIGWFDPTDNR